MRNTKLATIINFCSNDYPFLKHCITHVASFSEQILIPVCDHFFDGVPENKEVLNAIYLEHPNCQFIEYEYNKKRSIYKDHGANYWHNLSRLIGYYYLNKEIDYVLFLDTDEIIDEKRFLAWLKLFPLEDFDALRFSCYWYFREVQFQAKTIEDSPFLVQKKVLSGELLMHPFEREGCFKEIRGNKRRHVEGADGLPLAHHYSWVRTKDQMERKVVTWGQNWVRNWRKLVEQEFSKPFQGKDFVHGYSYIRVSPFISLDLGLSPQIKKGKIAPNVRKVNTEEMHKIDFLLR